MKGCSEGRLRIASVIVVLCLCGAGLATFFALRNQNPSPPTTGPTEPSIRELPNISFEPSKSAVYIGEKNVTMTCNVSKCAGIRRVDILHEKDEAGTLEIIATITTNSSYINHSRMTLIKQEINADSAILRTVFASSLACQDKGQYYCIVSGNIVSNETLELELLRKPRKPKLLVNRDIVEGKQNGMELPFTCEGDVGYPPGRLELGSNSTNYFFPVITNKDTMVSNETCQANQNITFYYTFSRKWHEKEIHCSAINNKSLESNEVPPFDSQILQVVPADYCQNRLDRTYYHPYNCSYYIDCVNGSVNIKECPGEQCFGLNETTGCNICEKAKCVPVFVANACSKSNAGETIPLSDVRCSMYITCADKMVHECPGNECFNVKNNTCTSWQPPPPCKEILCFASGATTGLNETIVCQVGDIHVTSVAVTVTPYRSEGWEMFYVTGVSGLGVLQGNKKATLTLSGAGQNQMVSISVHPLLCHQIGQYSIKINNDMCGKINITDNAEAPLIDVSNAINENETLEIRCRGNVGAPAKHIFLEVQFRDGFQTFSAENITNATSKDCDNERETNFTITATPNWNNSNVTCSVRNENNSVLSSGPRTINIVRPNISFELSKSAVYIGDINVSMSCKVSKYAGLKRLDILHEKEETGTIEIIATITTNSSYTNHSRMILLEEKMNTDPTVLRTVFASALTCQDKGRYYCKASGNLVLNGTLKFDLLRKPRKPTLLLNIDMVEGKQNGIELPFTCEGDIGYPPGRLELGSNSTDYFFPIITFKNTTISNETCQANEKITFYYTFSRRWHEKEIHCSAVNTNLGTDEVPPFDSQIAEVVPADFCQNRPDRSYYHPYNCSYYIDCVNGSVNIKECREGQCFGINETSGCNICEKVTCVRDVVAYVCSKPNAGEIVSLADVSCSTYVNCTDKMVHECPGNECFNVSNTTCTSGSPPPPCKAIDCIAYGATTAQNATVACPIGDVHVTSVAVTVTPGRSGEWEMFYVTGVNGLGVLQGNKEVTLTVSGARAYQSLSIGLHPLQCRQIGQYIINVNNVMCGRITVTDNAEVPNITLSNAIHENRTLQIRCRGNVGAPAKHVFLEVQFESSRFQNFSAENITNVTSNDCDNIRETNFTITATLNWNNSIVRCSVRNEDNSTLSSTPQRITIVIPSVTLQPSKSIMYIGDKNFLMTCVVSNYLDLKRVELYHESKRLGTRESIAIITESSTSTYKSGISLADAVITPEYAFLRANFTNPLTCNDGEKFVCVAIGNVTLNSSIELVKARRPNKPTLFLSRDIVEGRENQDHVLHTCEGDVGYPAGKLLLASNFTISFNSTITNVSTTVSDTRCESYQKITFKYAFSRRWDGQELRCSVVSEKSFGENETSPFDVKVVKVVSADSCMDRSNGLYYHHYNCSNFISCVNKTVYIQECQINACFGLNETGRCNDCAETICVPDVIRNVCSSSHVTELVPYNRIRCSMYVNCTDRTMHECPRKECFNATTKICPGINCSASESTIGSNATIFCTVGVVNVTSVSVKITTGRNVESTVFYVNGVNTAGLLSSNSEASLTLSGTGSSQTLSIGLNPLQCHHIGLYSLNVNNILAGEIRITDNAEVPFISITNVNNETGTMDIICGGNVGAPAKEIFLEVRIYENTDFHIFPTKTSTYVTLKDCDNQRDTNFTIILTQKWNNSLVRCSVKNENGSIKSSEQLRIILFTSNVVTLEPSKGRVYIGDTDLYMTCTVSNYKDLKSVEIFYASEQLATRERIASVTKQNKWSKGGTIIYAGSNMTDEYAFLRIRFANVACVDGGIYQCVAVGNVNFTSSLELDIFSEPNVPTLTLSPWVVENQPILKDRMFRCDGMVGKPASQMFVEANISGLFQEYLFPTIPSENNVAEVQCNTRQLYQFYHTFNMSWNGIAIRCAVKNVRTNEIMRSSFHILQVVSETHCTGKGSIHYPHPYECQKFIICNNSTVFAVGPCGADQCFGFTQTAASGCTFCSDKGLQCYPGAHR